MAQKHLRLLLILSAALFIIGAFDTQTVECEQAIAHAKGCCDSMLDGEVHAICGDGCNSTTLAVAESECIQDLSCEQLREQNICQRLIEASDLAETVEDNAMPAPPVCP